MRPAGQNAIDFAKKNGFLSSVGSGYYLYLLSVFQHHQSRSMNRRLFLNSGITFGASAFVPLPGSAAFHHDVKPGEQINLSSASWADIRKQFLLVPDRIHMTMMLLASHPKPVREAIKRHRKGIDADPVTYAETQYAKFERAVRDAAAAYIGSDHSEIALTDSTTMGLSILCHGFRFKEGDEILTTTHDHYSTEKSLEFAAAKSGATVRSVALYDDPAAAQASEMVHRLKTVISERTRLVAITHVHSCTGVKTPVKQIAGMIRDVNQSRNAAKRVYLSVDGVHGFGIENTSMDDLGCDFFAAGTHKWMFGPRGTGILFAKKDSWDMVAPVIPAFEDAPYLQWMGIFPPGDLTFAELCTPGGFHSFEHRWALDEAFIFMSRIGKERIQQRTHELSTKLKEGLSRIRHVRLITPMSPLLSSGINCFEVDGMRPDEVVKKLHAKHIIASASPYKTSYVRLTPCMINTEEEVEICIRTVETIRE